MDCSVYKEDKYTVAYGTKMLRMGYYLTVAHTTHLPWAKIVLIDTLVGRDICYNGKGVPW